MCPDYPHNEVRQNKGVNHFPDGVFQRCRTIINQEKDAERERLKKARRMKTKILPFSGQRSGAVVPGLDTTDSSTLSTPALSRNTTITAPFNGNTNLEAMWLLEQNYDIESSPFGSPARARAQSSALANTVPGTPVMSSPARTTAASPDLWDESMAAVSTRSRPVGGGSSINSRSSRVVVPLASGTSAGIAAPRPFPALEQQMMYQQQVLAASSRGPAGSSSSSSSMRASASTPQLLIGSPARRSRSNTPNAGGI